MHYFFDPTSLLRLALLVVVLAPTGVARSAERASIVEPPVAVEATVDSQAIARSAQYLASDALEGRGLQTKGLLLAGEYIRDEFRKIGLELWPAEAAGFQEFEITASSKLLPGGLLELRQGPNDNGTAISEQDYSPQAFGTGGKFDRELAFVGYGISAPELNYDDYAGIDVKGRIVVIMRHEPRQDDPHSPFDGKENSRYAPLRTKASNAYQHGAAGVVFITDAVNVRRERQRAAKRLQELTAKRQVAEKQVENGDASEQQEQDLTRLTQAVERWQRRSESDHDDLMTFRSAGDSQGREDFPVMHSKRAVIDDLLKSQGKPDLEALEQKIDEQLAPQSFLLDDVHLAGELRIERQSLRIRNVVGILPGCGALAGEAVVVGAHYDHLGRGERGSAAPKSKEIHNGADDNASGVVALLQIARTLAARDDSSRRQIIFAAFTGEERGLLGSAYFVDHPPVPLDKITAMLNFDMVGRIRNEKLIVFGFDTGNLLGPWLDELNRTFRFDLVKNSGGLGPSDHANFCRRQIPVLHFFSGYHDEYHRPGDDFELLNLAGIQRVAAFGAELIAKVATNPEPLEYEQVEAKKTPVESRDPRPYFGSIPDFAKQGEGYAISGAAPNSPADEGGLQAGDRIVQLGPHKIGSLEDFDLALRKLEAGETVSVIVVRKGVRTTLEVTLEPPK